VSRVRDVPLGYEPDKLLYVQTDMRGMKLSDEDMNALTERLLSEARTIPGIVNGTSAISVPFRGGEVQTLHVDALDAVNNLGRFELQAGTPDYFATMGTRIVRGRGLTTEDRVGAPLVAVVSEAMGAVLWRGEDPIGKCFRIDSSSAPCTTVVGIAEDIKAQGFASEREFHYYLPMSQKVAQLGNEGLELFVRFAGEPSALANVLRSRLQRLMPGTSFVTVMPFQEVIDPAMRSWTLGARMFLAFGALALVLAAIGLYGVIAFAVAHRTQEIGMRIALGARTRNVLGLVVGEGVRVTLVGVVLGTVIALVASRGMSDLLFRVSPQDPLVYGAVAATLAIVAILACTIPATRAARVDPSVALRSD
jgi:putative ABC transport system permease protein